MKPRRFYASEGLSLATRKEDDGRAWCMLFPVGQWARDDFPDGQLELDGQFFASLIESWTQANKPSLPITYHHVDPWAPPAEKEAAGWIEDMRADESGLWGLVKWTSDAKQKIEDDKYRYLSPEWSMSHVSRRSGEPAGPWCYGAALLNDPFFHEMPRVAAAAPTHQTPAAQAEEQHMSLKRINRALGLPEGATEDLSAEAVEKLVAEQKTATEKLTASANVAVKLTALEQTVEALKASNANLETENAKAKAEMLARDVESEIGKALNDGKAVPEQLRATVKTVAEKLGLAEARQILASLPKSVEVRVETGTAGDNSNLPAHSKLEARVASVAKELGINRSDAWDVVLREGKVA